MQFLFLTLIYYLYISLIIYAFPCNYSTSYQNLDKILTKYILSNILSHLERVLTMQNPSKLHSHTISAQSLQAQYYRNYLSINKNMLSVEEALNKEEYNKYIAIFLYQLKYFFSNLHITSQNLVQCLLKKERLIWNRFFLSTPYPTYIN